MILTAQKFEDVPDGEAKIPPGVLLNMISLKPGEIYRPEKLDGKDDSDLKVLRDAYGVKAYIHADVRVSKTANVEKQHHGFGVQDFGRPDLLRGSGKD